MAKISGLYIPILILLIACNDKAPGSPYSEILGKPPYNVMTDSIKKFPGEARLYFRRAVLLNQADHVEPALEDFKIAWELQKKENHALGVATILLEKKPDSAAHFLQQAMQIFPESFLLKLALARAYEATNQDDKALQTCDELLKKYPDKVDVLKMKSALLDKKGDLAGSLATLERAYQLTPYELELNYILGLKYAETKNPRVLQLADSLIKKDSAGEKGEPYYYKGIYYSNINEKAKAVEQFDLAIQRNIYLLEAYIEKGAIFFEQKKYREALSVFQLVNNISPAFADAYYWVGRCQEALGNKSEARLNYERAFGLDKSFIKAKEAAERIRNKE